MVVDLEQGDLPSERYCELLQIFGETISFFLFLKGERWCRFDSDRQLFEHLLTRYFFQNQLQVFDILDVKDKLLDPKFFQT